MSERGARTAFWAAIAVASLLLTFRAGSVPLLDPDESRFARTSVEMQRSGDLVVPRFEGRPRLVKPPLLHWMQSALFRALGAREWVARLHAILATLGSIVLVAWVARRRFGAEGAFWAAAVLATSPLFMAVGRLGTLDALLALHVLAVLVPDLAGSDRAGSYRGLAVGALLGLGFLVKGPVGLVLPLLVMLAGRTVTGRDVLPSWIALFQGVAGWSLVVLPWGLAFIDRVGLSAAQGSLRSEAFERYFAGTTHVEPFWFYLPVVAVGLLPWLAPLLLAIYRALSMREDPAARTAAYAAAGLLAGLVFFSLGKSKLPSYIVPLVPLAALLVAWQLGQELRAGRARPPGALLLLITSGLTGLGLAAAGTLGLDEGARTVALVGAAAYGAASFCGLAGWWSRGPRWAYGATAAASAAFLLAAVGFLLPEIADRRSSAGLIEAVPRLASSATRPLVLVDMKVPSLTFYLDRVPEHVDMSEFSRRVDRPDDPLIVFDLSDLRAVEPGTLGRLRRIGGQGKYVVFEKIRPPVERPPDLTHPGSRL